MVLRVTLPSWRTLLLLASALRVALVAYSEYYDALPTTKVKYTDVDYRVFSDATRFVWRPGQNLLGGSQNSNFAKGSLGAVIHVGDPYERATYRYTPMLALLLLPNEFVHPAFGKLLFVAADILIAVLLRRIARLTHVRNAEAYIALGWLFNPLSFSISTRGSSEAVLGVLVLAVLHSALRGDNDVRTAALLGLAVHFKIYPFIYGAAFVSLLSAPSFLSVRAIRFAILSVGFLALITIPFYLVWGQPFLQHAYLYHIGRLDHRHNFSPYFYPTYLSYPARDVARPTGVSWSSIFSFVPQLGLSGLTGLWLGHKRKDLPFAFFVQTALFVTFNKVCTSQYFLWYIWFLPVVLPRLQLAAWEKIALPGVWVAAQALWLGIAYQLEFERQQVFFPLWCASIAFLVANSWVLVRIMQAYGRARLREAGSG
ncbi:hypothetical protein EXIGLDRAFT_680471 [Exidia glandulosa HHB12029]|uniref:GPI mannosyltransferase 1 n=1 Tax=Exidia glandulosa HHB12029 TaxID=1314781 RepID=A0A165EHC3_EXIGL|nr:hypothetical protein EXIGLDRAFT_680471 [Exidia glandulosa HHB12029]